MKIIRYTENNIVKYGELIDEDELSLFEIFSDPYTNSILKKDNKQTKISKNQLLIPCSPSKIICFAINYQGITNFNNKMLEPIVFLKAYNSICLNNSNVKLKFEQNTWGESEIGVVIKKKSKNVPLESYHEYIHGYISANDISSSNIENRDHHLARSKSADGYCPVSNYIDTSFDPHNKIIESYHNDLLLRKGSSNQMFWGIDKIISWLSTWMTLYPEDVVLTGSPPRVRDRLYLSKGDTFKCKIEGFSDLITYFE